ncbi:hypothetical protein F53441_9264 [Fusarium austroafricanum]|uniref:Rhodanese domain-containing protein n=1 Tax=Fusarium austroafricanum TaxID=2364996 RepID=A0A8H4NQA8_9HYPO|nr:hypothetical protein F53441_9264 [Fusarium austroafricanum]
MASRRALVSSALRASSVFQSTRPIFTIAARSIAPRATTLFTNSTRRYSVKAKPIHNVDGEPKAWNFEDIKKHLDKAEKGNVVIIDVREPRELFETGKIPGAINIPITTAAQSFHIPEEDFEDMYGFQRPGKDKELLFYCKAGVRARAAAQLAQHAGWQQVGDYSGSWLDWEAQNGPVEKVNK